MTQPVTASTIAATIAWASITSPATFTNLGPLITPIPLPSECTETLLDMGTTGLGLAGYQSFLTQGCALSSCCPSSKPYTTAYGWLSSYYSPAVCPVSYTQCPGPAEATATSPDETVAFCCPFPFECPSYLDNGANGESWFACFSSFANPTTAFVVDNILSQNIIGTTSLPGITSSGRHVDWPVIAYPIQIRWRSEDFAIIATAYTGPGISSSTPVSSSSATQSPDSGASLTLTNAGGVIAMTAVGTAVVVVSAATLIWCFVRRRRRRQRGRDAGQHAQRSSVATAFSGEDDRTVVMSTRRELSQNDDATELYG